MPSAHCKVSDILSLALHLAKSNKLASLEATLVRNYDSLTHSLTGVRCRATSVANKKLETIVEFMNDVFFMQSNKMLFL